MAIAAAAAAAPPPTRHPLQGQRDAPRLQAGPLARAAARSRWCRCGRARRPRTPRPACCARSSLWAGGRRAIRKQVPVTSTSPDRRAHHERRAAVHPVEHVAPGLLDPHRPARAAVPGQGAARLGHRQRAVADVDRAAMLADDVALGGRSRRRSPRRPPVVPAAGQRQRQRPAARTPQPAASGAPAPAAAPAARCWARGRRSAPAGRNRPAAAGRATARPSGAAAVPPAAARTGSPALTHRAPPPTPAAAPPGPATAATSPCRRRRPAPR